MELILLAQTRDLELRERIPHAWASSNDNPFTGLPLLGKPGLKFGRSSV